jgi:hypothetical protein
MVELGESHGFPAEALSHLFIGESPGGQHFDGDISFQAFISSPIDNTHPSGTDFFDDAIMSESLTYHGGSLLEIQPKCKNSLSPGKAAGIVNDSYQTLFGPFEFGISTIIIGILYHRLVIDVKLLNLIPRRSSGKLGNGGTPVSGLNIQQWTESLRIC